MLKIKDNVDLKELEKFGLRETDNKYFYFMKNFLVGANKSNYHYINVNVDDFKYDIVGDIKNVVEGDICPVCNGKIYFKKGIEIGNLFKLGTKYSESLGLNYLNGSLVLVVLLSLLYFVYLLLE